MYPRNNATPPEIDLGQVLQLSDGAVQTTGVAARVKIGAGAWGAAAGTLAVDTASGIWTYTPTQAETNAAFFIVAAYKTGCSALSKTVITSEASTSGRVVVQTNADKSGYSLSVAPPTAAANATAVRSELATELGRIDAAVSSRLAGASYTAPPTAAAISQQIAADIDSYATTSGWDGALPTLAGLTASETISAAQVELVPPIATAVRSELATELGRIDVAVSSRLATAGNAASIGLIQLVVTQLATTIEPDGADYRFTAAALALAPAGGGGSSATDWTADERAAIRAILGVPASGSTPETPAAGVLADVLADTAELQAAWADGGRLDVILDTAAIGSGSGSGGSVADGLTMVDILSAAADPKSAQSPDGMKAEAHSLPDLIEADKYLKQQAAAKDKRRGVRFAKLGQGGSVGTKG